MLTEFGLIARFFTGRQGPPRAVLGIGDDCALLAEQDGQTLAISTDMLVAGRHFFPDCDAHALGHKSLAVNLSDLAAMGAAPRAFTLALALPHADEAWLTGFSAGLFALAERFSCELIGGDTTAGPLTISITVLGDVPRGGALTRGGAQAGDDIWVSGVLGDARLALGALRGEWPVEGADLARIRAALERPEPRIALGLALRGVAHAALDVSDGLMGDVGHLATRSGLCAALDLDALPRSAVLARQPLEVQQRCTVAGGDDYELCFTAPDGRRDKIEAIARAVGLPLTRVGRMTAFDGHADTARVVWHDRAGTPLPAVSNIYRGFDHFHAD